MEDLKKHFPALLSGTYLNTAANGLVSKPLIEWRRQHDLDLMQRASTFRDNYNVLLDQTRLTVSSFFGANPEEIALVPNISFALNTILEGLPKKQKILLLKNDYPSVNWPVETRGFDVCYATINENLEQNIEAAVNENKPDIFIFSIVQWLNGIKIDFEFLNRLKSYHPNLLLIADGTQFLGTEDFNFAQNAIDVLGASAYKWLNAGFGNGFVMVKNAAKSRIFPKTIGFNSAEKFESEASETKFIKHFEPGHLDTFNFGSLNQAILFQKTLGVPDLYKKIATLSQLAKTRFSEMGLLQNDTALRENHSPIFNIRGDKDTFEKLKANNIICSLRGGGIRVSFHYYNTEDDLNALIQVLK